MNPLSILIFTEDSSPRGFQTLEAILHSALKFKTEEYQTRYVKCEPVAEETRKTMSGSGWQNKDPQQTTKLLRDIAVKLKRPDGFVVFHFDGDKAWSTKAESKNQPPFEERVWAALPSHLAVKPSETIPKQRPKQPRDRTSPATVPAPDPREKLITMVPFYSIESWLFQNTGEVKKRCQEQHSNKTPLCDKLPNDRGKFDEILEIKDKCCLKGRYNSELASNNFPTREVYAAEKSFKVFVDSLRVIIEFFDKPYVDSKQEELTTHWELRDFTPDKLPKVNTRKEMDRLLSLLENMTLTEDEILQQFAQTPDGYPGQGASRSGTGV